MRSANCDCGEWKRRGGRAASIFNLLVRGKFAVRKRLTQQLCQMVKLVFLTPNFFASFLLKVSWHEARCSTPYFLHHFKYLHLSFFFLYIFQSSLRVHWYIWYTYDQSSTTYFNKVCCGLEVRGWRNVNQFFKLTFYWNKSCSVGNMCAIHQWALMIWKKV